MSDASQALSTISQNFGLLDTANGGPKDGLFNRDDLKKLLDDQNLKPELRQAVLFLLNNDALFNQLDTAGQEEGTGNGNISADTMKMFFLESQINELSGNSTESPKTGLDLERPRTGLDLLDRGGVTTPPKLQTLPLIKNDELSALPKDLQDRCDGILTEIENKLKGTGADFKAMKPMSPADAAKVLKDNFKYLDGADGVNNGAARLDALETILNDKNIPKELEQAIIFFLDNPSMAKAMEVASANNQNKDGLFNENNLNAFIRDNTPKKEIAPEVKGGLDNLNPKFSPDELEQAKKLLGISTPEGLKQLEKLLDGKGGADLKAVFDLFGKGDDQDNTITPLTKKPGSKTDSSNVDAKELKPDATPIAPAGPAGGGLSIGDIARLLGQICENCENALKSRTESVSKLKGEDLTMEDQRKLQELGEILKAFATLFANLIKLVAETGDKSASKI